MSQSVARVEYHFIQHCSMEYLTECDTTAGMAELEGLFVLLNVTREEAFEHAEFHSSPNDLQVQ